MLTHANMLATYTDADAYLPLPRECKPQLEGGTGLCRVQQAFDSTIVHERRPTACGAYPSRQQLHIECGGPIHQYHGCVHCEARLQYCLRCKEQFEPRLHYHGHTSSMSSCHHCHFGHHLSPCHTYPSRSAVPVFGKTSKISTSFKSFHVPTIGNPPPNQLTGHARTKMQPKNQLNNRL